MSILFTWMMRGAEVGVDMLWVFYVGNILFVVQLGKEFVGWGGIVHRSIHNCKEVCGNIIHVFLGIEFVWHSRVGRYLFIQIFQNQPPSKIVI